MLGPNTWIWTAFAASVPSLAAQAPWDLGNGFSLTVDESTNHLSIARTNHIIWETVPNEAFLSASTGLDRVVESSGKAI